MKTIYSMAAAAILAFGAQAQTISFTANGVPVEPGTTIKLTEPEITFYEEDQYGEWLYNPHLFFTGSADGVIEANAKAVTPGCMIQFCLAGSCELGTDISKVAPITGGVSNDTMFEYSGNAFGVESRDKLPIPKDVISTIDMQYQGKPETHVSLTIICNPDEEGGTISVYENAAQLVSRDGVLEYSIEGSGTLAVYDTNGTRVISSPVEGNGTVSTAGLSKGVYIYTLGAKSGKLVVK